MKKATDFVRDAAPAESDHRPSGDGRPFIEVDREPDGQGHEER